MKKLGLPILVVSLFACGTSDDVATPLDGSTLDAPSGDSTSDGTTTDGATSDGSASDGSTNDGAIAAITCDAPTTVDTLHIGSPPLRVVRLLQGDQTLVTWGEHTGTINLSTLKSRLHDGTTWQPERTFTAPGSDDAVLTSDGLGDALFHWNEKGALTRHAAVMTNVGTWGAEASYVLSQAPQVDVVGLPAGGGVAMFAGQGISSSINAPQSTTWSALESRQAGLTLRARVATNPGGKTAAMWARTNVDGYRADITVATYGGTWALVPVHTVGVGGAGTATTPFGVGVLANGDPIVAWTEVTPAGMKLFTQRYQIGTSTWAAADKAWDVPNGGTPQAQLFVDGGDRITVVLSHPISGSLSVFRDTGSGWPTTPIDLGAQTSILGQPVMDPASGNLAILVNAGGKFGVARIAAGAAAFAPVTTSTFLFNANSIVALGFDGTHAAIAQGTGSAAALHIEVSGCQ
ncbi:hypothetical protein BH09MYX1_BH09MYX1_55650 [soil metagenome]